MYPIASNSSNPLSWTRTLRVALRLLFPLLLALGACTGDTPSSPAHNNPLDPENPATQGDPYQLSASLTQGGALLNWLAPDVPGIELYHLYRSVDDAAFSLRTSVTQTSYLDLGLQNGHRYSYYVLAVAEAEAPGSGIAQLSIDTAPVLVIGDGAATTITRDVPLTFIAYGALRMRIWEGAPSDSSGAPWQEPVSALDWQLSTGAGSKTIYAQAGFEENDVSPLASASIAPAALLPQLSINAGELYTPSRYVSVELSGTGATAYQLSNEPFAEALTTHGRSAQTPAALPLAKGRRLDEDWSPLENASATVGWELETGMGTKTVYLLLRNDFFIEARKQASIQPRLPSQLSFQILGGDTITTGVVTLHLCAQWADSVRIANEQIETQTPWQVFGDTLLQWELEDGSARTAPARSTGEPWRISLTTLRATQKGLALWRDTDEGAHQVQVQFKNSFEVPSSILQDEVVVEIPARVTIADGATETTTRFVQLDLWSESADEMAVDTILSQLQTSPHWQPFVSQLDSFALAHGAGMKHVFARFRNASGAISSAYADSIEVAAILPSLIIGDGSDSVLHRLQTLQLTGAGAVEYQLANESPTASALASNSGRRAASTLSTQSAVSRDEEWLPFVPSVEWLLSEGAGEKIVTLRLRNDFLVVEETSACVTPAEVQGRIDFAQTYTRFDNATLAIQSTGALEMALATEAEPSSLHWEPLSQSRDWPLTSGDGWYHVHAWLRNEFQQNTGSLLDSIARDTHCALDSLFFIPQQTASRGDTLLLSVFLASDSLGAETGAALELELNAALALPLTELDTAQYQLQWPLADDWIGFRDTLTLRVGDRAGNVIHTSLAAPRWACVSVPAGDFRMGDVDAATPEHEVTLTQGVLLDAYEVSNAQYAAALQWAWEQGLVQADAGSVSAYGQELLDLNGVSELSFDGALFQVEAGRELYPVMEVSWYGAACYCDWRSTICGLEPFYLGNWAQSVSHNPYLANGYRLPTEAEWEYAAQFDDERDYPWGDTTPNASLLNYDNLLGWTAPTGSYPLTGLGFFELAGNVQEWCGDWWASYSSAPATDPLGAATGTQRVLRGGDWFHDGELVRCADRNHEDPASSASFIGFRTVCSQVPSP